MDALGVQSGAGGLGAVDKVRNVLLLPQVVGAVFLQVIVSGGVMDARGYVVALSLSVEGLQMGACFLTTYECAAHLKYKKALFKAIDTGMVVSGRYYKPLACSGLIWSCSYVTQFPDQKRNHGSGGSRSWGRKRYEWSY